MRGIAFASLPLIAALAAAPAAADKNEPGLLDRPSSYGGLAPGHPCGPLDDDEPFPMDDEQSEQWHRERDAQGRASLDIAIAWAAGHLGCKR